MDRTSAMKRLSPRAQERGKRETTAFATIDTSA
jgi:hypothetical protein